MIHAARAGRALWHLGALLQLKALMSESDERFWALEGLADRHMAVPLHAHSREDEIWYVLEGQIRFTLGAHTYDAGPGSFAYIPRGVAHMFQVVSETTRWFGMGIGGTLDQWFFETGAPAGALTLPPPAAPTRRGRRGRNRCQPARLRHRDARAAAGGMIPTLSWH